MFKSEFAKGQRMTISFSILASHRDVSRSESLAYSIVTRLPLSFLSLLIHFVDQADRADHVGGFNFVRARVIDLFADLLLLNQGCVSCELLDEFKGVDHLLK